MGNAEYLFLFPFSVLVCTMDLAGKYKHYKGKEYEVVGVALHSESLEKMVVYKPLYETPDIPTGTLWVRPFAMFFENVLVDGASIPRFYKL